MTTTSALNFVRAQALKDLQAVLAKYNARLTVSNEWRGYAECGEDLRLTFEFDGIYDAGADIDLGTFVNATEHGGKEIEE